MKELIVVAYDNQDSAREVLYQLRWLNYCWVTEIGDAVVVVRDQEGNLHVQDSYQPTTRAGGGWGMLWGMLLGSVLLALGSRGCPSGVSTAAIAGTVAAGAIGGATLGGVAGAALAHTYKEDFGLPEDFVSELSTQVKPGGSAIFALLGSYDADPGPEYMARYFRGTGARSSAQPSRHSNKHGSSRSSKVRLDAGLFSTPVSRTLFVHLGAITCNFATRSTNNGNTRDNIEVNIYGND